MRTIRKSLRCCASFRVVALLKPCCGAERCCVFYVGAAVFFAESVSARLCCLCCAKAALPDRPCRFYSIPRPYLKLTSKVARAETLPGVTVFSICLMRAKKDIVVFLLLAEMSDLSQFVFRSFWRSKG